MNSSTRCFVERCLSGLRGRLYHLVDKVVRAGTAHGPNNSKHNNNNYNRRRWDVKSEGISRNNIPRIKVNEWEELVGELMWIYARFRKGVSGNQSNGNAGTKACDDAGKAIMETVPGKDYILLPLWTQDPPFSSSTKDSPDAGFKPSKEEEKKDAKDPGSEKKDPNANNTNNINTVSPTVNAASIEDNVVDKNIVYGCADDSNMPDLEDIVYSNDDEDDGAEADMTNLDTHIPVSPILTTRIHKDHPFEQIIKDIHSAPQTRRMTKNLTEHAMLSSVQ
ncbi:hypothetical protein Tco_0732244 [Tanacetum coccineum]